MPTINLHRFYSQFALPSVKNYILFSAILFFSGFYYYYRIIQSFNLELKIQSQETQNTEDDSNFDEYSTIKRLAIFMRKHRLLFFVLLNTCCAFVALMGKILTNFFFGTISNQEESYIRKYMRRYIQTKITFLIFISHHNLLEDILIWTPWLAIQILCLLLLELTTLRMTNAYNIISNAGIRRKMLAVSSITGLSSLFMVLFVFSISDNINIHYRLFLVCDCSIVFIQSLHLLCSLFILHDLNVQNQQRQGGSYYLDLTYGLLRDCLEFVNYLHMIFYSQLAITYCCVFLIIQAQFYYSRIATKMRKHWQQREIINHINNSYLPASEEDLLKNEQCLICWQTMKSARKLPCSHIFHEHCLRRWLEQDSSCAICRKSLSLNLNNLRQRQNLNRIGDDMNQTMQMLLEAFSPQNSRVTRWWSRFLFDTMNEEQITVMVNQVSEMFPQLSVDIIRQLVSNTGSLQATIDAILEGNALAQQNNPIGENNGNGEVPRNAENDDSSSDESYTSSETAIEEIAPIIHDQQIQILSNDQPPNFLKTKNAWLNNQMEKMLAINRSNYLNSPRGRSLRLELENAKKEKES